LGPIPQQARDNCRKFRQAARKQHIKVFASA
jgi:hypothetical protein